MESDLDWYMWLGFYSYNRFVYYLWSYMMFCIPVPGYPRKIVYKSSGCSWVVVITRAFRQARIYDVVVSKVGTKYPTLLPTEVALFVINLLTLSGNKFWYENWMLFNRCWRFIHVCSFCRLSLLAAYMTQMTIGSVFSVESPVLYQEDGKYLLICMFLCELVLFAGWTK